jgi:hypothetical protein
MRFKNFYFVAVLLLTACLSFTSCGKDEPEAQATVTLELTGMPTDTVPFPKNETTITVKVSDQTAAWTVESSAEWASFDPRRGHGDGTFKLTAADNDTKASRSATITVFLSDNKSVKKEFTIVQAPLSADFEWTDSGNFAEKCVGVEQFGWMSLVVPALYYKHTIIEKGTLTFEFSDSHIHIFLADKEPGYYDNLGNMTFATSPTVDFDTKIYPDGVIVKDADGNDYGRPKAGDVTPQCPRSKVQRASFRLNPGTYWSTHSLETNGSADSPECADPNFPDLEVEAGFDAFTTNYTLKVTFIAD